MADIITATLNDRQCMCIEAPTLASSSEMRRICVLGASHLTALLTKTGMHLEVTVPLRFFTHQVYKPVSDPLGSCRLESPLLPAPGSLTMQSAFSYGSTRLQAPRELPERAVIDQRLQQAQRDCMRKSHWRRRLGLDLRTLQATALRGRC
jgi:hypothetical protein